MNNLPTLKICEDFFNKLYEKGIVYVHWKSNEHLLDDLQGKSDLDLLFFEKDKDLIHSIFQEINVKFFCEVGEKKYSNIVDYLGLDNETGTLVHFHVHYALVIGEKGIKGCELPWINEIMDSRIVHPDCNIQITSHEYEIIILLLREAFRISWLDIVRSLGRYKVRKGSIEEFEWLQAKINKEKTIEIAVRLINDKQVGNIIEEILNSTLTVEKIFKLRKKLKSFRMKYDSNTTLSSNTRILRQYFQKYIVKFYNTFGVAKPNNRINPNGGLIIALIGCDGSGKSTMVKELNKLFDKKIWITTLYFGIPKPKNYFVSIAYKILNRLKLTALYSSFFKHINLEKAIRIKNMGGVVICDRYPQSEFNGIMDGPLLASNTNEKNFIASLIAEYEKGIFEDFSKNLPDIIFKIIIDVETAVERKKIDTKTAQTKIDITRHLNFGNTSKIITIDQAELKLSITELRSLIALKIWEKF